MRPSILQSSTSSFLKFLNYLQTFAGAFVLLYSLWMLNDWNRHGVDKSSAPWFVYTMMAFGVFMCLIALVGYIAAGVVNGFCLCSYAVFILILILIEAGLMADLLFNEHWEEDFPHDATEELKSLRAFIEANIDIFKWVAVTLVVVQDMPINSQGMLCCIKKLYFTIISHLWQVEFTQESFLLLLYLTEVPSRM
ncbi:tetraspanin-18-like isoform X2 [Asparagus officinalis]|uniref:tetraspanin-18-like isoform X2 n=1 Tax=Asparagus officinalis TaxID=4686 RepID=UPI00098E8336|nr:tetraspanin-18-like isoform X2 [Asparagus officinalis]